MYTVKLLTGAEVELSDACKWYDEQRAGLGRQFLNKVTAKINLIEQNPFHYNIRFSSNYRCAPLNIFPYLIVYRIEEDDRLVYIISIFHTSRNSSKF